MRKVPLSPSDLAFYSDVTIIGWGSNLGRVAHDLQIYSGQKSFVQIKKTGGNEFQETFLVRSTQGERVVNSCGETSGLSVTLLVCVRYNRISSIRDGRELGDFDDLLILPDIIIRDLANV